MSAPAAAVSTVVVAVIVVVCGIAALTTVTTTATSVTPGCAQTGCGSGWVAPLPAGTSVLVSGFGPRGGRHHDGVDLAAAAGTPIYATAAGTVTAAGCTSPFCDRPGQLDNAGRPVTAGCGWRVTIVHAGRVATVYCHAVALAVTVGQTVLAGQVIGWVGSTGHSTGPHLHLQIHTGVPPVNHATAVNPVGFLASVGVAV